MWFTRKSIVLEINSQRKRFLKMKKTYANRHGYIGRIPQHSISVRISDSEQNSFIHSSALNIEQQISEKHFPSIFLSQNFQSFDWAGQKILPEKTPHPHFLFFSLFYLSFFSENPWWEYYKKIKNPKPNQITTNQPTKPHNPPHQIKPKHHKPQTSRNN